MVAQLVDRYFARRALDIIESINGCLTDVYDDSIPDTLVVFVGVDLHPLSAVADEHSFDVRADKLEDKVLIVVVNSQKKMLVQVQRVTAWTWILVRR